MHLSPFHFFAPFSSFFVDPLVLNLGEKLLLTFFQSSPRIVKIDHLSVVRCSTSSLIDYIFHPSLHPVPTFPVPLKEVIGEKEHLGC